MDVVVDVLAGNDGSGGAGLGDLTLNALVRELSSLTLKASGYLLRVAVLEMPVLDTGELVLVLLWEDLTIEHGLHRGVVVVLVNLLVDGGLDLLMAVLVEGLVGDGGSDLLVDGGVVVAGLGPVRELSASCNTSCGGKRMTNEARSMPVTAVSLAHPSTREIGVGHLHELADYCLSLVHCC